MPQTEVHLFKTSAGEVPARDWLDELAEHEPRVYAKCLERIRRLSQLGYELRRPLADYLRDGIYELRIRHEKVNYRLLYFFCGQNISVISHGLTKEKKVPSSEIDRAIKHKQLVEEDFEKHTEEFIL